MTATENSLNASSHPPHLGRNFVILSLGETFSKLLTFSAFAFLARVLGPEGFGAIEFALAILFVFSQVVDFGTEKIGAVMVAGRQENLSRLVANIVSLRLLASMAAFAILLALVVLLNEPWTLKQVILLYGLSLFLVPGLLQWVFQGLDRMSWVASFSILRQVIFASAVFLWIREPRQIWMVAIIEVAAVLGVVIFNFIVFDRYFGKPRIGFDRAYLKSIISQAFPMYLSQLMMALKLQLPAILLGILLLNNEEVAWFRAAHRIVFAINTFGMLYLFNLLPSIARCNAFKKDELKRLMSSSLRVVVWSTIFVSVLATLFAKPLISLIFGPDYSKAADVLKIMIWLLPLFMLSGHFRSMLFGLGYQKLDFVSTGAGAIVTAILCILSIATFSALGAAVSMVIAEIITWLIAYYFVRRKITLVPILRHLIRPAIAALMIAVGLQFAPSYGLWFKGGVSCLLFLVTMQLLQPTILSDIRSLAFGIR